MKVTKNFLGPEKPLPEFWRDTFRGSGESAGLPGSQALSWPRNATFRILAKTYYGETLSEEVEKVLGNLVTKHFLRFP